MAAAALAAVMGWAYYEPRSLDAYKPYIEETINAVLEHSTVKIGSAKLRFNGFTAPLVVDAQDVYMHDEKKVEQLKVEHLQFSYGLKNLVFGNFIPSSLSLIGVKIDGSKFFDQDDDSELNLKDFDLSHLKKLELKNGIIAFPNMEEEWKIDNIILLFSGAQTNISGKIIPSINESINLGGKGYPNKGDFDISAKILNFNLGRLKHFVPELKGVEASANGVITASFKNGKISTANSDISSFSGKISSEKLKNTLDVKSGLASVSYNFDTGIIALNKTLLQFTDGFNVNASGYYTKQGDIKARFDFSNLAIDNIKNYWPKNIGENAIKWMSEHLAGGVIPIGNAKLDIKGEDIKNSTVPKQAVALSFDIIGTDVNYTDNLLPVKSASGKAFMDANSLNIKISEGGLGSSKISNTIVDILDIGSDKEKLKLEGDISGGAKDLADFYIKINKSRGKKLLFDTVNDMAGNAITHMQLSLPLISSLKFEQVSINLVSKITDGIINSKAKNFAARNANITLNINDKGYFVKGGAIGGYSDIEKKYNFTNIPLRFSFSEAGAKTIADIDADITNSEIALKEIGAMKPKGEKGRLEAAINDGVLNKLSIDSSSIKLSASGILTKNLDDIQSLKIANFESAGNKFAADITKTEGYDIKLKATQFNAAPILDNVGHNKEPHQDETKINLIAQIEKLGLHQQQVLENVGITANCAKYCDNFELRSKDLNISKTAEKLHITSFNAGKVLKMLDAYDNMNGGTLEIEAKGIGNDGYEGIVTIVDFSLVKAKVLVKILTLGSLTGIADTLGGKGIGFKKLKSNFKWDEKQVKIDNFRMFGAAIGATTEGTLDRKTDKLDFGGKIIPAYTANTLLGKIPVLGDIIIGDTGVFAFAYTVKGTSEEPEVFVNPLSVLAPGFLQEIFQ